MATSVQRTGNNKQGLPPCSFHHHRERHLQHQLQEAQTVEVSLRQELHAQSERHATSVLRLTSKAKEADFACQEAKRQLAALRLSNKSLTLDQAQSILEGEDVSVHFMPAC